MSRFGDYRAVPVDTARHARSGYFTRWYCQVGHAHRTEEAARECTLRFERRCARRREAEGRGEGAR